MSGRARALRPGVFLAFVLVVVAAVAACSSARPSAPPPASAAVPVSPVTGVLLDIDSSGLSAVEGFTLRLDDGRSLVLRIGTLENGEAFPVGHLAEHLATSSPIRVFFRADGPDLVVYRLEDAG